MFKRNGLDIIYDKEITLLESLIGFTFILNHINNKKYKIKVEEITIPNSKCSTNNMGFIRNNYKGKLIISYTVKYPKTISLEKKNILKSILL